MGMSSEVDLQRFFPKTLEINEITEGVDAIRIRMTSKANSCLCPKCGSTLKKKRGTYSRRIQDLPILGKNTELFIKCREYHCFECNRPVAEGFGSFIEYKSRMTERCKDFIVTLALETSCEGASRILNEMGIHYSGDSIIRLLLRRWEEQPPHRVGDVIGVDDFSFKKRRIYGTVIVDGQTHRPVRLLDGRDGVSFNEWLQSNKHIKVVTRDRASAYAKIIREELPDAIQVADRFHLHQNLLEAIKKALNAEIPAVIPMESPEVSSAEEDKKRVSSTE